MDDILRDFDDKRSLLDEFEPHVRDLLKQLLRDRGIRVHSVETRVKERTSLASKLQRHEPPYASLEAITDLLGGRIITFLPDEIDAVVGVIEDEFTIDREDSWDPRLSVDTIDPKSFGYRSVHFVVAMSPARAALREWTRFGGVRFEIQVRTILQHAWAEIEHEGGYHPVIPVSPADRRRWSRLAALLEIADWEFVNLRSQPRHETRAVRPPAAQPSNQSADEIVFMAASAVEPLGPGQVSQAAVAIAIVPTEVPEGTTRSFRIALETPDVSFAGTPVVRSQATVTAHVESTYRAVVVEHTSRGSSSPLFAISDLNLSVGLGVRPGPVQVSVAVDGGRRRRLQPLGYLGGPSVIYTGGARASTVIVGRHSQATVIRLFTEKVSGTFEDGQTVRLRLVDMSDAGDSGGHLFTREPWLKVTTGDLRLVEGGVASPDNIVMGQFVPGDRSCAEWRIWAASTSASTLVVGDGAFIDGPPIDVAAAHQPGTVGVQLETVVGNGESRVLSLSVLAFRDAGPTETHPL